MLTVETFSLEMSTKAGIDILDLTSQVQELVGGSGVTQGLVNLFISGSTAALTTIEYETGVVNDLRAAIERLFPRDIPYEHDRRWGDGNGHSHVRASLLGASLAVPFIGGILTLGTWQQIIYIDFDIRPRHREIIAQIMGE